MCEGLVLKLTDFGIGRAVGIKDGLCVTRYAAGTPGCQAVEVGSIACSVLLAVDAMWLTRPIFRD